MDEFRHLDDYAVLGIEPGASPDEIKRAYRREIAKYHPDRFRGADSQAQQYARERSQRITEAYAAVTRNPRTRLRPAGPARSAFPASSAEQLAMQYDHARTLLATGRAADAARLLHDIQRVDPLYRDVDELLVQAEAASTRRRNIVPFAWLGGGVLALLLIGALLFRFADFRAAATANPPSVAEASVTPTANAPGSSAAASAPVVAEASVGVPIAGGTGGVGAASAPAPTDVPPPTEVPPSPTAAPPTEAPPPPTEIPPPTEVPPTPVPPTSVPAPTTVAVQPTSRSVALESGAVLVADDFSDSASGWANMQGAGYTIGYRNSAYAITSDPGTGAIFSYGSPLAGSNVVIGADATPVRGAAGLIFGPDNSYRFLVSADGRFRVEQRGNAIVPSTASRALRAGTNRLVIAAAGRRVSLYANGTLLANVDLAAPLTGTTYGFVVSAGARGGEGVFDNLTVRALPR